MKSPPAQAWLALVRACQEGDWHTVQTLVTTGRLQELETLSAQGKDAVVCRQQQIQQVLMRGVWAWVTLRDKTVISLRQRAGTWQVD
jgi:hypothetical protein